VISQTNTIQNPESSQARIECVDLFCGVGGLTHGLTTGGIQVLAGVDLDPQCRFPYEANNTSRFFERDIHNLSSEELQSMFSSEKPRLLAGCAPCQPFSTYSRKNHHSNGHQKWDLVFEFGRLAKETQPDFVTMENVPQLANHDVFKDFLHALDGYHIWHDIVDCTHYAIPQSRKRLVLLASKLKPIKLIPPRMSEPQTKTVRGSIGHLPPLAAGASDPDDELHTASSLSELNLRRIQASKPGGTWRDWDTTLVASCHRKASGQTYPSVYGRMEWDAPAPTITTQCFGFGNGRFGHPVQDRAISLREAAILQTFPEKYKFIAPGERINFSRLGRLIGNAVPVRIGEVIAQSFLQHINTDVAV
jgi:DNA (cytosine-5)-methyltransferase 1